MISSTELAGLRAALRLVQRDVDRYPRPDTRQGAPRETDDADEVLGLPGASGGARFQLVGTEQGVFVALPDGRFWPAGAGPVPAGVAGAAAVAAVAVRAQECLAEILWHSWPRCPDHDAVLRAQAGDEDAVWNCEAAGHPVAAIGGLAQSGPSPLAAQDGT
jgi:hypothetical protein